jgi:hypothetical protein
MNTGYTEFYDTSTAGNATIINSNGGFTTFWNSSTAGNATITTNLFRFSATGAPAATPGSLPTLAVFSTFRV